MTPDSTGSVLELTLRQASAALADRRVSSVELVEATLAQIENTEPKFHAYAYVAYENARNSASAADAELAAGYLRGPLHGIPIAVKDLLYTSDAPTEAGSRVLSGFVAPFDATVVKRLREGGAVIVGKVVTHEFAYGKDLAKTRNAWNHECNPGGSSAGSAVSVAVRSAYGSIGTDSGGSIRVPAALNGVVGLKPTYGRVSRHGVVPLSVSLDHVGPMARTVEDAALILQTIAGPDPRDATTLPGEVGDLCAHLGSGIAGMRIAVDRRYFFGDEMEDDVRSAALDAVEDLRRVGATIVEVGIPELDVAAEAGLTIMLAEASDFHRHMLRERGPDYDPGTRHMLELGELVFAGDYLVAQRARARIVEAMRRVFDEHRLDALVAPTMPLTAKPVQTMSPGAVMRYSFPANLTGQPAISVPCGFSSDGKPIAIQFHGRPECEAQLLRIAGTYEQIHRWHAHSPVPLGTRD